MNEAAPPPTESSALIVNLDDGAPAGRPRADSVEDAKADAARYDARAPLTSAVRRLPALGLTFVVELIPAAIIAAGSKHLATYFDAADQATCALRGGAGVRGLTGVFGPGGAFTARTGPTFWPNRARAAARREPRSPRRTAAVRGRWRVTTPAAALWRKPGRIEHTRAWMWRLFVGHAELARHRVRPATPRQRGRRPTRMQRPPTPQYVGMIALVSAISGNVGLQASTITVRALSHGFVDSKNWARAVWRETLTSIYMGGLVSLATGALCLWWSANMRLVFCVAAAQFVAIVVAGFSGSISPLLFRLVLGKDPGEWAGPLETAVQDIASNFMLFVVMLRVLSFFYGLGWLEKH